MISVIFILLAGFSGVLLSYMLGNKKLHRMIPISFMSIMTVLYFFGLAGFLKVGVVITDLLISFIYGGFIVWIFKHRYELKLHIRFILPCFLAWSFFVCLITYCDCGMMAHHSDEFSHWADSVKIMTFLDDFITNEKSPALFKSYPPGMALVQYFIQKNNMWFNKASFSDWRLYQTFHLFSASFLFPVFDKPDKLGKKIYKAVVLLLIVIMFFRQMLDSLYIDPFVSIVAAYSILLVVSEEDKDVIETINISLTCVCLVLAKDIGLCFALVAGLIHMIHKLICSKKRFFQAAIFGMIPLLSTGIAKLLWKTELLLSGTEQRFGNRIDLIMFLKMLFLKNGNDYRQIVVNNSVNAFFEKRFIIGPFGISYCWILIFFSVVLLVYSFNIKKQKDLLGGQYQIKRIVSLTCPLVVIIYSVLIGAVYAFRFTVYESLGLASYERYMNIPFLYLAIVSAYLVFDFVDLSKMNSDMIVVASISIGLIIGFVDPVRDWLTKYNVTISRQFEGFYDETESIIYSNCSPDDRIAFLSIGDSGFDHLAIAYYVRPYSFIYYGWSIGKPYYEGDIWTEDITPEDWMNTLVETADYVYIYKTRDEFVEQYSACFENPSDIQFGTLFLVDKDNMILRKV